MIPDLLNHPAPGKLVTSASPEDVVDALRLLAADDPWNDWTLRLLDRLFVVWSVAAIVRRNDTQGIADLQAAIDYACTRTRNSATLPETWRQRWLIVSDMLEARRQDLKGRDPKQAMSRKHVDRLLGLLSTDETAQADLAQALAKQGVELTDGRLSQLISLMEGHGLVEKRKDGRENRVRLTEEGVRHAPTATAPTPAPGAPPGVGAWTQISQRVVENRPWLQAAEAA